MKPTSDDRKRQHIHTNDMQLENYNRLIWGSVRIRESVILIIKILKCPKIEKRQKMIKRQYLCFKRQLKVESNIRRQKTTTYLYKQHAIRKLQQTDLGVR